MSLLVPVASACLAGALAAQGVPPIRPIAPGKAGPPAPPPPRIQQTYSPARVDAAFKLWDRDENQWLSYRELRAGLHVDRFEFLVMDRDDDGRVSLAELHAHLKRLLENGAVIHLPETRPASSPNEGLGRLTLTAEELLGTSSKPATAPFQFGEGVAAPSRPASSPARKP